MVRSEGAEQLRPPEHLGGIGAILEDELVRARGAGELGHLVVLVEGESDRRAIETLARRQGRDLFNARVTVVPIAGATNLQRFLDLLGPPGHGVELAGLCDQGEEGNFRRALQRTGQGFELTRGDLDRIGFFVCVRDLEEELIRALGAPAVLDVMAAQGHTRRFRSFQNQPAQREKTIERQIWRWLGNHKISYAPLMVEALDLDRVPEPMQGLLDYICDG